MSWQAMEAVQDHSQIEDHTGMMIMYAIARHADADGVVGAGGRITSPSTQVLADKARVSKRTLLYWLPRLEKSGELVVERNGAGRGQWNKYTIDLPMPADIGETHVAPKEESIGAIESEFMVQELRNMVQELKVMVQDMVQYGASHVAPDTKDTNKNDPKPPPIHRMAKYFEQQTAFPPPNETSNDWHLDWKMPLEAIYNKAGGDLPTAFDMIDQAIRVCRGENPQNKRYTIKTPNSILTSALNLSVESNGTVVSMPSSMRGIQGL